MNIVIASMYGFVVWFALILYVGIVTPYQAGYVILCGPLIVSGFTVAICAIDAFLMWTAPFCIRLLHLVAIPIVSVVKALKRLS